VPLQLSMISNIASGVLELVRRSQIPLALLTEHSQNLSLYFLAVSAAMYSDTEGEGNRIVLAELVLLFAVFK
jgi:hypothetical protein